MGNCIGSGEEVSDLAGAEVAVSSYVEKRKGYPETLTAVERTAMATLRAELMRAGVAGASWGDDYELCRWLRARKFDVPKTLLMIQNHIEWGVKYDLEVVYTTFHHADNQAVKGAYPRAYHKTDKVGRPLYIDAIGKLDINRINELATDEQMEREKIQDMEYTLRVRYPACSKAAGRMINQSLVIMDLQGFSSSIWNSQTRAMTKRLTGVLSDHYPETMGALFIVNAPSFFSAIWSFIKLFLDPGTAAKISILDHGFKKELLKHVSAENLPVHLGGTDTSFDWNYDQGPWVKGGKDQGPWANVKKGTVTFQTPLIVAAPRRRRGGPCCGA
ncbi:CRAL-TRIO domain-containing protein [Pavlovales sp. CCMP2436]|nr:CRAL-TRIO domain-containing protein [Pavlovales sp. CCMP2436]